MLSVPRRTPFTRNCTSVIVPSASVAVAVMLVAVPIGTMLALSGEPMLTTGDTLVATGTMTLVVAWLPALSVARARSV